MRILGRGKGKDNGLQPYEDERGIKIGLETAGVGFVIRSHFRVYIEDYEHIC